MYAAKCLGIDLALRSKHQVCVLERGGGRTLLTAETTPASLDRLLEAIGGADHVDVVVEPTALAWVAVCNYLHEQGAAVYLADTRSAQGLRKVISRDVKSDRADAEALALMPTLLPQKLHAWRPLDPRSFALTRNLRNRAAVIDDRTRMKLRIRAELEACNPGLARLLADTALGPVERALLRGFLDPRVALDAGPDGLSTAIKDAGCDPRAPKASRLVSQWLTAAEDARALYGRRFDFAAAQRQLGILLDILDGYEAPIAAFDAEITTLYRALDPGRVLESVPGVGRLTAACICAVFGGPALFIERFADAAAAVSYAGLDPRKSQTGGADREGQHISKAGNRLLRQYLYLAAETARQRDVELAAFYQRLVSKGKHHSCAVVAVAAKLLRRIYAVMKRAAAGDERGYERRDLDGHAIDAREARARVVALFPSKAARLRAERAAKATKKAEHATAQSTRQRSGSSKRSPVPGREAAYAETGRGADSNAGAAGWEHDGNRGCTELRS